MNLESSMLSEIIQVEKDKYGGISHLECVKKIKAHRQRKQIGGYQNLGLRGAVSEKSEGSQKI